MPTRALFQQYAVVPPSRPVCRPWLHPSPQDRGHYEDCGRKLHLEHQHWQKEQGMLQWKPPLSSPRGDPLPAKHPRSTDTPTLPRLGVCLTIRSVDALDPEQCRWVGKVGVALRVAVRETLAVALAPAGGRRATAEEAQALRAGFASVQECHVQGHGADEARWGQAVEECAGNATLFLQTLFGVCFQNLIRTDRGNEPSLTGPSSVTELDIDREKGILSGQWELRGAFEQKTDLRPFPFDIISWDCVVSVKGWSCGVTYDWSSIANIGEFQLLSLHGEPRVSCDPWFPHGCEQNVVPNSARPEESFVYVRFHSRRIPTYVLVNVVIPVALLSFLGEVAMTQAGGFITTDKAQTSALSIHLTLILIIVAIRFTFSDRVPKGVSSPTLLDWYIVVCCAWLILWVFITAHSEQQGLHDAQSPVLYFVFWLLLHLGFAGWAALQWCVRTEDEPSVLYASPHEGEPGAPEYCSTQLRDFHATAVGFVAHDGAPTHGTAEEREQLRKQRQTKCAIKE